MRWSAEELARREAKLARFVEREDKPFALLYLWSLIVFGGGTLAWGFASVVVDPFFRHRHGEPGPVELALRYRPPVIATVGLVIVAVRAQIGSRADVARTRRQLLERELADARVQGIARTGATTEREIQLLVQPVGRPAYPAVTRERDDIVAPEATVRVFIDPLDPAAVLLDVDD
jgi:hypothetical protein